MVALVIQSNNPSIKELLLKIDGIKEELNKWDEIEKDAKQQSIDLRDKMLLNYEELRVVLGKSIHYPDYS